MATHAEPVRRSKLITMPKRSEIDWGIALFWVLIVIFATVEGGAAIFGFKAFMVWAGKTLEGLIR